MKAGDDDKPNEGVPADPERDGTPPNAPAAPPAMPIMPSKMGSSMILLQNILDSALDPGYRAAATKPPANLRWWRAIIIVILSVLLGLGTGISIRSLRSENAVDAPTRKFLIEEVSAKQELTGILEEEVRDLEQAASSPQDFVPNVSPLPNFVMLSASADPIGGPGVSVELRDREKSAGTGGIVRDADLRIVVNLLWQAGAEAVAINGVRLGPSTTIRTAGSAIFVDLEVISEPYMIEAVGDPDSLYQLFSDGNSGEAVRHFVERSGLQMAVKEVEDLSLPAGRHPRVEVVSVVDEEE